MKLPLWLQLFPTRVRGGLARGARWSLLPYSGNWRYGGHERDVEQAVHTLALPRGAAAWDFGAHFGIHTVGLALWVGPEGQVAAFEPNAESFARCAHHVRINHLTQVVLFDQAVSDAPGQVPLIQPEGTDAATVSHLAYDGEEDWAQKRYSVVEKVAPDDLVARGVIRVPDFIKVDLEGHGGQALQGSIRTITASRPSLLVSFHSPQEADRVRALLEPLKYVVSTAEGEPREWADCVCGTSLLCTAAEARIAARS